MKFKEEIMGKINVSDLIKKIAKIYAPSPVTSMVECDQFFKLLKSIRFSGYGVQMQKLSTKQKNSYILLVFYVDQYMDLRCLESEYGYLDICKILD